MQPFSERHGLRGAMVAPTKIIAGLGLSLGLELLPCAGSTGDYRSDFGAKVRPQTLCGARRCWRHWLSCGARWLNFPCQSLT